MTLLLCLILSLLLLIAAIEDWKFRAIRTWYFPVIFALGVGLTWPTNGWVDFFLRIGGNMAYSLAMIGIVALYFRAKGKALKDLFGIGDLIFYLAITPLFSFVNYLLFFSLSLVFSLLLHGILFRKNFLKESVPLAGYLSIQLIPLVLLSFSTDLILPLTQYWTFY
ncbi:hypothetical protein KFE98_19160 [bacterium SCSIO 12741]|nr:hypothetical protein KFE98_19160 [bacterium SCSIO 12741]